MRKHSLILMTTIALVLGLACIGTAGDEPFGGTWKLNLAKSKVTGFKSLTMKAESIDNGLKQTFDIVNLQGTHIHSEYQSYFDGKDYPVKGDPGVDTAALTRIDATTYEQIVKKSGEVIQRWRVTVSKDGKILIGEVKTQNAKGQENTTVCYYDKQ